MESPLAAIETNRNIEQETPRAAAGDKDQGIRLCVSYWMK